MDMFHSPLRASNFGLASFGRGALELIADRTRHGILNVDGLASDLLGMAGDSVDYLQPLVSQVSRLVPAVDAARLDQVLGTLTDGLLHDAATITTTVTGTAAGIIEALPRIAQGTTQHEMPDVENGLTRAPAAIGTVGRAFDEISGGLSQVLPVVIVNAGVTQTAERAIDAVAPLLDLPGDILQAAPAAAGAVVSGVVHVAGDTVAPVQPLLETLRRGIDAAGTQDGALAGLMATAREDTGAISSGAILRETDDASQRAPIETPAQTGGGLPGAGAAVPGASTASLALSAALTRSAVAVPPMRDATLTSTTRQNVADASRPSAVPLEGRPRTVSDDAVRPSAPLVASEPTRPFVDQNLPALFTAATRRGTQAIDHPALLRLAVDNFYARRPTPGSVASTLGHGSNAEYVHSLSYAEQRDYNQVVVREQMRRLGIAEPLLETELARLELFRPALA